MIRVYCDHITPRHRYIFDFIFKDILGAEYQFITDKQAFESYTGPRINYSEEVFHDCLQIRPHPILSENDIKPQETLLKPGTWNLKPETWNLEPETHNTYPFDPFAIAFFLVTRYEEYLPFEPDEHGRFKVANSTAYKENFLRVPLVDKMAHELKTLLEETFTGLKIPGQPFRFIPSFDIDIAFAHLGKGVSRAAASWAKLFLQADIKQINERMSTLSGRIKDPYDNFSLHSELAKKFNHPLIYFVLLGDFGKYDRNTSYKSNRFRELLNKLNTRAEMGLHPSYRSFLDPGIFNKEKKRLEAILQHSITKSRFHFLRLKFPESCRLLISQGVTDDYSPGYSTLNGFRASTCTPFIFYDLHKEEITNLRIHPFIFMDSAMIDHLKLTPEEAFIEITTLVDQVKKFGGEAIGIWHNYSLSEKDQYKGWQEVLVKIFEHYKNTGS